MRRWIAVIGAERNFALKAVKGWPLHGYILTFCFLIVLCQVLIIWTGRVWNALPHVTLKDLDFPQSVRILDRDGHTLYHAYDGEDRVSIDASSLPFHVRQAFMAAEDERFYSRSCIDPRALTRAFIANLHMYKSEGASTITQQLVRQLYLSSEKTFERKVGEIFLACTLEFKTDKDTILSAYLNRVSFGGTIHGIEQAAQIYFSKHAADLSLAESVFLSAIPQRPTTYSPYRLLAVAQAQDTNPFNDPLLSIRERAQRILMRMNELEWISDPQLVRTSAELEKLRVSTPKASLATASHFTLLVRSKMQELMDKQDPAWRRCRPRWIHVFRVLRKKR
jgi:membrane peptidoglycan carboxypeptidase